MPGPSVRVDLHTHTHYSLDARMSPATLVARARTRGIDRIAVTDHNAIDGAREAHALDPDRVIVGEEVRCEGFIDIIGLFLTELIPAGLPVETVAQRIRAQGGVVYAPHPFAYPVGTRSRAAAALAVADVVEVVNARAFLPWWNRRAARAASQRGLPGAAGSDAHFPAEIGWCYAEMPSFTGAQEFLDAVRRATLVQRRVRGPLFHVASLGLELTRRAYRRLRGGA